MDRPEWERRTWSSSELQHNSVARVADCSIAVCGLTILFLCDCLCFLCSICKDLGLNMFLVDAASVRDMWVGETDKKVQMLFQAAGCHAPCDLVFDEADNILAASDPGVHSHDTGIGKGVQVAMNEDTWASMGIFVILISNQPMAIRREIRSRCTLTLDFSEMQYGKEEYFNVIGGVLQTFERHPLKPSDLPIFQPLIDEMMKLNVQDFRQLYNAFSKVYKKIRDDQYANINAVSELDSLNVSVPKAQFDEALAKAKAERKQTGIAVLQQWEAICERGLFYAPELKLIELTIAALREKVQAQAALSVTDHVDSRGGDGRMRMRGPRIGKRTGATDSAAFTERQAATQSADDARLVEQAQTALSAQKLLPPAYPLSERQLESVQAQSSTSSTSADQSLQLRERDSTKLTEAERQQGEITSNLVEYLSTDYFDTRNRVILLHSPHDLEHAYPDPLERRQQLLSAERALAEEEGVHQERLKTQIRKLLDSGVAIGQGLTARTINDLRTPADKGFAFELVELALHAHNWLGQRTLIRMLTSLMTDPTIKLRDTWSSAFSGLNALRLVLSSFDKWTGHRRDRDRIRSNLRGLVAVLVAHLPEQVVPGTLVRELELAQSTLQWEGIVRQLESTGAMWSLPAIVSPLDYLNWHWLQVKALRLAKNNINNILEPRLYANLRAHTKAIEAWIVRFNQAVAEQEARKQDESSSSGSDDDTLIRSKSKSATTHATGPSHKKQTARSKHIASTSMSAGSASASSAVDPDSDDEMGITMVSKQARDDRHARAALPVPPVLDVVRLSAPEFIASGKELQRLCDTVIKYYDESLQGRPHTFAIAPFATGTPAVLHRLAWFALRTGQLKVIAGMVELLRNTPDTQVNHTHIHPLTMARAVRTHTHIDTRNCIRWIRVSELDQLI